MLLKDELRYVGQDTVIYLINTRDSNSIPYIIHVTDNDFKNEIITGHFCVCSNHKNYDTLLKQYKGSFLYRECSSFSIVREADFDLGI